MLGLKLINLSKEVYEGVQIYMPDFVLKFINTRSVLKVYTMNSTPDFVVFL